jgi:hemoglobin/transferrin/lactoferrin receptor protein
MAVRSVGDLFRTGSTAAGSYPAAARKGLGKAGLTLTVSAAALTLAGTAFAQETPLPGIDVQGAQAKKSSAAKKKSKPAPVSAVTPEAPPPAASNGGNQAGLVDSPYDTPAGVSVAGQGEIQTFGQTDLNDVFRSMPGVSTRENPNSPGIAVNIRGFEGSGRVNMMIDGVRQNFRFTDHDAQGFAYVDPLLLSSIEVQRGAVSTVGGAGALAGSANLRTLDVEDVLRPGQTYGALTSLNWGSNGLGFSEMGAGAIASGNVSVIGAISKHDRDDYENGAGVKVPFTGEDLISGLAKVHIKIDPEQKLSFGTVLYNNDFVSNSYDQTLSSQIYTASYSYKPIDNNLVDFRANFSGSHVTLENNGAATASTSALGRTLEDTGLGFDLTNISRFRLGAVGVKSEYGYEFFHDDVDGRNSVDPSLGGGVNPSGEALTGGAFSETTFSYSIFDLIAGLRYDHYSLDGSGMALPGNPIVPPGPYNVDRNGGRFDPKITLAATPYEWLQPYFTYSETMRAPTVSETLLGGIHPGSTGISFAPNPFLQPETQKGIEVGANIKKDSIFTPGDSFRFKGDYFRMFVENYVTANFSFDPVTFTPFAFFENVPGISRVEGIEIQGNYDAGMFFAGFSYTHTNTDLPSQLDGLGAHSYLPDDVATVTGGVRLLDQRLTVGARGYFASRSFIGEVNQTGPSPYLAGYQLLDLFGSYKFDNDIDLSLTVSNVTNVDYTPALTTSGTGFSGDTGRGRTFLLSTRAKF